MSLRSVELAVCGFLLLKAVLQYRDDKDWWLCVPIYAFGAVLCMLQSPKNVLWRALSAVVILAGGLLVAFLMWTMHHLSNAAVTERFDEGRNMLALAAAVTMVTGIRLRTGEYGGIFACIRTLLLIVVLMITLPAIAYSLCYYSESIPYCSISFLKIGGHG